MGCRCSDIPKCSSDINKIEEISSLFNNTEATNVLVSTELKSLSTNCMATFYCDNMFQLMSEENKLNDTVTKLLPKLVKECEEKVERLRRELKSMISEDSDYHEDEDDDDDDD